MSENQRQVKKQYSISENDIDIIKAKMLEWASHFNIFAFYDNNYYTHDKYSKYECILGVTNTVPNISNLNQLQSQIEQQRGKWIMGHINYDYKNQIEQQLSSSKSPVIGFPECSFFLPEVVINISKDLKQLEIITSGRQHEEILNSVLSSIIKVDLPLPKISFTKTTTEEKYKVNVALLREHIAAGDCYEINYCIEGVAQTVSIDTVNVYKALNAKSPAPFATLYKLQDKYLMCASPERYIAKRAETIISQPIKGTAKRSEIEYLDVVNKSQLYTSEKERAENIMIVDLVRNDLSKNCKVGSINVEELFGIYSFPQVHQMISTITGTLAHNNIAKVIRDTFPMGSMTGAPKYKVMQLIDQYEDMRRELFSGTVGYIDPDGDIDFNVVIRSLHYNETAEVLCYRSGGAITFDSNPDDEWQEVLLKSAAIEQLFT